MSTPLFPIIKETDSINKDKIISNLVEKAIDRHYKNLQDGKYKKLTLRRLYRKEVQNKLRERKIYV